MAGDVADRAFVFVAKVIFLLTGVWWGVGIQLMVRGRRGLDAAGASRRKKWADTNAARGASRDDGRHIAGLRGPRGGPGGAAPEFHVVLSAARKFSFDE